MRSDRERLQDVLQALQEIEEYSASGRSDFAQSQQIQSAVIYQLIIIGEAIGDLDRGLIAGYSKIPWQGFIGMRNILTHQYFRVDIEIVWKTIDRDLPALKTTIQEILKDLEQR